MLKIRNYVKVKTLEEAYELYQKKANRIIGGMVWMRLCDYNIATAIDLSDLGLDKIEENDEQFSIGCMATLRQIELHEGLNAYTNGSVCDAVKDIVGVQLRNLATVGGTLYGRYGFSDVLTVFSVLDSYVELYKGGIVPLKEYIKRDYDRDILVRLIVKKTPLKCAFECVRNTRTDFSVLNCAVAVYGKKAVVAVGARPLKTEVVEGVANDKLADKVADSIKFGSNMRGSAEYRKKLCQVLVNRALAKTGCNQ
jgi:CO/xanthine dehydrogenase FAD-binding subunit